jgi:hypothetical protein
MINGAHALIYSTDAEADRAFLRDVLKLAHVDVGGGWLIFALPPAEVAIHPGEGNDVHELYLMCENVGALIEQMRGHAIACTAVEDLGWGLRTQLTLPGGGRLGVYEPRHARPPQAAARATAKKKPRRRTAKKSSRRGAKKAGRSAAKGSRRTASGTSGARSRAPKKRTPRRKALR